MPRKFPLASTDEVASLVPQLEVEIERAGIADPSDLYVTLLDYSRHEGVRDLKRRDLCEVLENIGKVAISPPVPLGSPGEAARGVVFYLCPVGHSTCQGAAERILEMKREGTLTLESLQEEVRKGVARRHTTFTAATSGPGFFTVGS